MDHHVSILQAKEKLRQELKNKFTVLLEHGDMSVEYYAPEIADNQTPHKQDEIYVIASGRGKFIRESETINFTEGDVLFVPACMPHHFYDFSPDFATWVIFYGPKLEKELLR